MPLIKRHYTRCNINCTSNNCCIVSTSFKTRIDILPYMAIIRMTEQTSQNVYTHSGQVSGYFLIRNFFFQDTKISASTRYVITASSHRIRPSTRIRIHSGFTLPCWVPVVFSSLGATELSGEASKASREAARKKLSLVSRRPAPLALSPLANEKTSGIQSRFTED